MEMCPEIAKISLIDISLACSIGKSYGSQAMGLFQEFFRAETDPKVRFESIAHNLMHYFGFNAI
jgi:hypothetical protein